MAIGRWFTTLHAYPFTRFKKPLFRLTNVPGVERVVSAVMDKEHMDFSLLPVNENIEVPEGAPVPFDTLERLIGESVCHVILDVCYCRTTYGCREYDPGFACLFLGEGAREISPRISRHVDRRQALEHASRACEMGLVPTVGKFKGDAIGLRVKDHKRLMTVCFCCPCCCITTALPYARRDYRNRVVRLEGLKVEVGPECVGCGRCLERCIFLQRKLVDGRAVVGDECKGCGRCVTGCKTGASRIVIDNPRYIDDFIDRVSMHVDVWSGSDGPDGR